MEDTDRDLVELAHEVLGECRVTLMMAYRFLDAALWRMPFEPTSVAVTIDCDGTTLRFNPARVLRRFRENSDELVRDMLHVVVHCILRQPFDAHHENTRAWWLACDMAAEAMAMDMAGTAFPSALDRRRAEALDDLRSAEEPITPELLYRALDGRIARHEEGFGNVVREEAAIRDLEALFARDAHVRWPVHDEEGRGLGPGGDHEARRDDNDTRPPDPAQEPQPQSGGQEQADTEAHSEERPDAPEDPTEGSDEQPVVDDKDSQPPDAPDKPGEEDAAAAQAEQDWEDISRRVQEDLETFSREHGRKTADLLRNVTVSNRKSVDYADFLRRFATMREDMKINDDEFDYIFYTYGLELYGNMPLVEPLEYRETERVRDFVVAIDTSGSCAGEPVEHFIDRTFQILTERREFEGKVNVHIIQCDAAIREDVKITSREDLARFQSGFQVKGLGGTDFRPVFEYVDALVEEGEFDKLGGLIYFTDGYGDFPKKPPAYPTAFVFVEDRGDPRLVPPWAMKVVVRNDEVNVL